MPAPDAPSLLRRNATDPDRADRPAVRFGDRIWTHAEFAAESMRFSNLLLAHRPTDAASVAAGRPTHVGVLSDNTPDYLFAFGGAAFAGATVVGLNPTRVGEHLLRDIDHTDVDVILTEPAHLDDLAGLDLGDRPVIVSHRFVEGPGGGRSGGAGDLIWKRRWPTSRRRIPTSPCLPPIDGPSSSPRARRGHPRP